MKDETKCCKNTILFCGNMALSQLANRSQHETSMILDLSQLANRSQHETSMMLDLSQLANQSQHETSMILDLSAAVCLCPHR